MESTLLQNIGTFHHYMVQKPKLVSSDTVLMFKVK